MSGSSRALQLIDALLAELDEHPQSWTSGQRSNENMNLNNINSKSKKKNKNKNKGKNKGDGENKTQENEQQLSKSQLKKLEKKRLKEQKKEAKLRKQKEQQEAQLRNQEKKRKKKQKQSAEAIEIPTITKDGIKSTLAKPLLSHYNSLVVESTWDEWWEKNGFYNGLNIEEEKKSEDGNNSNKPKAKFVMMIPPPNVTGSLHLGHALMCTIEDCITRYWRMKGYNCLWLPGTDHAGIATQTVVERRLFKDCGKTRLDYGREGFLEKVWEWKNQYGGKICNQIRKLGCSVDWSREVFTMDKKLNRAVNEAFVRLYNKSLIYRDNRLCHWSCALESAISDAEVDPIQIEKPTKLDVPGYKRKILFGVLDYFRYPIAVFDEKSKKYVASKDEFLTIATTRLETMLGDTGVAVHSQDPRYKKYQGKYAYHPFLQKTMPIVCDDILVDPKFGTGVVKVTPAHDENDFECGKRNKLEFINIFTNDGKINDSVLPHGKQFHDMKRFDCRDKLREELKSLNLYVEQKPNEMSLGICSRSHDIIEPMVKEQWYCNCENMAKMALDVVDKKELKITPEKEGVREWHNFLDNIRPWCISRQLWWGHRIPAWLVCYNKEGLDSSDKNNWIVARNEEEAYKMLSERLSSENKSEDEKKKYTLSQDEDVLDTWFSSGIFPFSTLGWPDATSIDLQSFFPGSLLETGSDILFFWVARMVMMSLELMDGQLPFKHVFLHPMVRDKYGKKMSKTKGNVIDPLHIINGVELQTLIDELSLGNIKESEIKKFTKIKKQDFPNGIERCGADSLRFGLLTYLQQGRSINLDVQRIVGYSQFCNKIWNATKFALSNFDSHDVKNKKMINNDGKIEKVSMFADKWILSRLSDCVEISDKSNSKYDFAVSTNAVYQFFLHDLCDVYLELIKPIIYTKKGKDESKDNESSKQENVNACVNVLYLCLDTSFRLFHPFMPFVSEELWQRLRTYSSNSNEKASLMVASFPNGKDFSQYKNDDVEKDMILINDISFNIRAAKQGIFGLRSLQSYPIKIVIKGKNNSSDNVKTVCEKLTNSKLEIATLTSLKADEITIGENDDSSDDEWYRISVTTTHPVYKESISIEVLNNVGEIVDWSKRISFFTKKTITKFKEKC